MKSINIKSIAFYIVAVFCLLLPGASGVDVKFTYDALDRLTQATFADGAVVIYTYDAAGNRLTYTGVVASDNIAPSIAIANPSSVTTSNATFNLSGTASDNRGVSMVTWTNDRGGIGTATGTNSWFINGIRLQSGANVLSVTAHDLSGNTASTNLTVTLTAVVPNYRITLTSLPSSGGMVSGNGSFPSGSSRTVTAIANSDFIFVNWTENGNLLSVLPVYNIMLTGNRTLVANFVSNAQSPQLAGLSASKGVFRFALSEAPGSIYLVLWSSNLFEWLPFSTNVIPSGGSISITDSTMATNLLRFFRAVPKSSRP